MAKVLCLSLPIPFDGSQPHYPLFLYLAIEQHVKVHLATKPKVDEGNRKLNAVLKINILQDE